MTATERFYFETQKPEDLMEKIINCSSDQGEIILDFFAGSGTTLAVAHKLKRKWIGIEIGEVFKEYYTDYIRIEMTDKQSNDVLKDWVERGNIYKIDRIIKQTRKEIEAIVLKWGIMGRMKMVMAAKGKREPTILSRNINWQGGGFFKYHTLEQYEDALDNIELKENNKAQELFKDEYLLKYFLDFETRGSEYLLNIEKLKNPFAYKLKINEGAEPKEVVVDIPETFNYLLGLKVKKIKVRYNEGKKYLFILGEKEGRDYTIIWREYQDDWTEEDLKNEEKKKLIENEFKKDKEFIKQELKEWKPQVVYINGQSVLTTNFDDFQAEIRYIEPEFKRLMED